MHLCACQTDQVAGDVGKSMRVKSTDPDVALCHCADTVTNNVFLTKSHRCLDNVHEFLSLSMGLCFSGRMHTNTEIHKNGGVEGLNRKRLCQ